MADLVAQAGARREGDNLHRSAWRTDRAGCIDVSEYAPDNALDGA
jgi:hypothetical protein